MRSDATLLQGKSGSRYPEAKGILMLNVPSQRRRGRQATGISMLSVSLLTMALATAACGSAHRPTYPDTAEASAGREVASSMPDEQAPERNPANRVSCDDLGADPLLGEQELACSTAAPTGGTAPKACPDICIEAIIVEVDEDHWKVIRVEVLNEKGDKTSAIVHRTAGYPAAGPEVGKRVEFTCTYQYDDDHGMRHYGDCYQGSPEERSSYELDEMTGPGDVGGYELL